MGHAHFLLSSPVAGATVMGRIPNRRRLGDMENVMIDAGHDDRTIQRGLDEALACQDMLARVPPKPSPRSRMTAWLATMSAWLAAHRLAARPEATPLPADYPVTR